MPTKKVQVNITGTVHGFADSKMSNEEAQAALALDAEQRINKGGDIRAHLSLAEEQPAPADGIPAPPWASKPCSKCGALAAINCSIEGCPQK